MTSKTENIRMTISLSPELNNKIEKLADLQHTSKNATITSILDSSVDMLIKTWSIMTDPNRMSQLVEIASRFGADEKEQFQEMKQIFESPDEDIQKNIKKADETFKKLAK